MTVDLLPIFRYTGCMKKIYKLDAVGTLYPMIMTKDFQSLFRLECTLFEAIDKDVLQQAVDIAFLRFPYFKICLKKDKFRYVFEDNDRPFIVKENDGDVLNVIDFEQNNGHLIELSYKGDKVILEVFHAVTDANGACVFLKSLIYHYIAIKYGDVKNDGQVLEGLFDGDETEYEDAQFTHRKKTQKGKVKVGKMIGATAFCPRGEYHGNKGFDVTSLVVDAKSLHTIAKEKGLSVTQYLSAVATFTVSKLYKEEAQNKNIVIFIPVNLRKRFKSKTMRNFVTFAKCTYPVKDVDADFLTIAKAMQKELMDNTTDEELQKRINFSTLLERLFITKYMPLPIVKKLVYLSNKGGKQSQTFILSNIGVVSLPDGAEKYVKDFTLLLNTSVKTPRNIAVATFNNRARISFTSRLKNKEVETAFMQQLKEDGVVFLEG